MTEQMLSVCTINQRTYFATSRLREWQTFVQPRAFLAEWLMQFGGWTRLTYMNHLLSLYDWCQDAGLTPTNPVRGMKRPPQPRPRPKPLPQDDWRRVTDAASGDLYTWLQLGRLQGLRSFEIAKIHGRDIDSQTLFVRGKNGAEWTLPTHPEVWRLAQQYPRDGYWFPSRYAYREHASEGLVGRSVREHFRVHGIPSGSIHRMRHTYATELRRAGVDTRTIQDLMRHDSLDTTQLYLEVATEEKEAAIRLLTP